MTAQRLRLLLPFLLVALAASVTRLPMLRGEVGPIRDDRALLVEDHRTADLGAIPETLGGPYLRDHPGTGLYRPLVNVTLTVERVLFGDGAFRAHRAVNLTLHVIASLLFLLLARRLVPDRPVVPVLAAVLFAEHPAATETIGWITARAEPAAAVFSLLAILLWLRGHAGSMLAAALSLLVAMLFQPVAAVVPVIVLLLEARRRSWRSALSRRGLVPLTLLVLPVVVAFLMRHGSVGTFFPGEEGVVLRGTNLPYRLLLGGGLLVRDLAAIVFPIGLTGDYRPDPAWRAGTWSPPMAYLAAGLLVLAVAGWLLLRRRRGGVDRAGIERFGWLWAVLFLLPVLQIVPIGSLLADRFLYLPAMGVALAGASFLDRLAGGVAAATVRARLIGVGVGLLLGCFAVLGLGRNAAHRDDGTFHRHVLARFPEEAGGPRWRADGLAEVMIRLGHHHESRGEPDRAAGWYGAARERSPRDPRILRRQARMLLDAYARDRAPGRLDEAERLLGVAASEAHGRERARVECALAVVYVRREEQRRRGGHTLGDPTVRMRHHLEQSLRYWPDYPLARWWMGVAIVRYGHRDDRERGRDMIRAAVALDPALDSQETRRWLRWPEPSGR